MRPARHVLAALLLPLAAAAPARELEVARLPDGPDNDWRYDMRMVDFASSVYGLLRELNTPELVERRMAELRAQGASVVILNGLHMHLGFLDEWPRITEYARLVAQVAHRHGMKVVFHHDVTVVQNAGKGINRAAEHPEWLQRDVEFDRPTLRMFCVLNPGFRKAYLERIVGFAKRSGVDGLMLDEAHFTGAEFCGCEHCRAAFARDTGKALPASSTSRAFNNADDPLWVAWLDWRREAVGDWWVALRRALDAAGLRTSILNYTTHSGMIYPRGAIELGLDLDQAARGSDSLGTEIMARNAFHNARAILAMRKIKSALGARHKIPIWGIIYHLGDPTSAYAGWALLQMSGHSIWTALDGVPDAKRHLDWADRMPAKAARPLSDVAVLFSTRARDFGKDFVAAPDAVGFSECLDDAHVQHDVVLDADLRDPVALARYKLLVLPSAGPMGPAEAAGVREYVRKGGSLLVTANSTAQDEAGARRDNFLLADLLGVDREKGLPAPAPSSCQVALDGPAETVVVPLPRVRVKPSAAGGAKVLGRCGAEPAITVRPEGKGRCLYVGFPLGAANYEPELRTGTESDFVRNPKAADLLARLVKMAVGGPLDLEADGVPREIGMTAFVAGQGGRRQVYVHLLNMAAAPLRKGQAVPNLAPRPWEAAFPAPKQDLLFRLRCGRVTGGQVSSPEFEGRRPLAVAQQADGSWQVTVAKGDLAGYALVRLDVE
jgi:hypothetical protein